MEMTLDMVKENKLCWEDSVRTYGKALLNRVQERYSDIPMVGIFIPDISGETVHRDVYFTIKKGKSLLAKFNPFARKIARVDSDTCSLIPDTVTIFDGSLRNTIEGVVEDLNEESGLSFEVRYK